MRQKEIKVKDIADRLGISQSTVSKALHNASDISPFRKREIQNAAVEMGYVVRSTQKTRNRKLAVLLNGVAYEKKTDIGYDLSMGFRQAALRDLWGVDVLTIDPEDEDKEKYDGFLLSRGYQGAFLVGFSSKDTWYKELSTTEAPAVLLDDYIPNSHVCEVSTDTGEAVSYVIDHLTNLGHRKITFWNGPIDQHISQVRESAFLSALLSHGLSQGDCPVVHAVMDEADPRYVDQLMTSIINSGTTAILCRNDLTAIHLMDAFMERGIRVPEDLSIVGFDDIAEASEAEPPLTTVRQNRNLLGQAAFFALVSLVAGIQLNRSTIRSSLIVRKSTGPAPRK